MISSERIALEGKNGYRSIDINVNSALIYFDYCKKVLSNTDWFFKKQKLNLCRNWELSMSHGISQSPDPIDSPDSASQTAGTTGLCPLPDLPLILTPVMQNSKTYSTGV